MNERNERIVALWEEGKTSSAIAKELKITRNTVMGVIHRLKAQGVKLRGKVAPVPSLTPPVEAKMPRKRYERSAQLDLFTAPEPPTVEPQPEPEPEYVEVLSAETVSIHNLDHSKCKYILGPVDGENTAYCGEPVYYRWCCESHYKLCYIPHPSKRSKKNEDEAFS